MLNYVLILNVLNDFQCFDLKQLNNLRIFYMILNFKFKRFYILNDFRS